MIAASSKFLGQPIAVHGCGNGLIDAFLDALSGTIHGVGIHANIITASLRAILSAVNRATQVNPDLNQSLSQRFAKEPLPVLEH